ncbi:MAG: Arm DNA-binding domain-containing protein, partial [Bacteroidota bacterium]
MKSNQKLSLLFWVKKTKVSKKDGKAPLYARITIDGKDEELSLGRKINPQFWDVNLKRDCEPGSESKKTNSKIEQIKVDLERHFAVLQSLHEVITPAMLKNVFTGLPATYSKDVPTPALQEKKKLFETTDEFISMFEKMVNKNIRSFETLKQWRSTRKKLEEFILFQFKNNDILEISEIVFSPFQTKVSTS